MRRALSIALASLSLTVAAAAQTPGWLADPRNGCKVWTRNVAALDAVSWSGNCVGGLANGKGELEFLKGGKAIWKGDANFVAGKREGRSKMVSADGWTFDGEYRDGQLDGQVIEITSGGDRYEGEYRNGRREGHGVYQLKDGLKYEGDFKDGQILRGTITFPDGATYVGGLRNNRPHGQGAFTGKLAGGEIGTISGTWRDGCFRDGAGGTAALLTTRKECGFG